VRSRDELLQDPDFARLLRRRSRLRWGLSALLTAAYLAYGLAGLYLPDVFAAGLGDSSLTVGVVLGYGIILLGIACSVFYVRQVNRIIAPLQQRLAGEG
jgi:uncharacterized membrane protein (DUF485 family)